MPIKHFADNLVGEPWVASGIIFTNYLTINIQNLIYVSFRSIRAKMPKFRPGLSAHNISLAAAILKKYDYSGSIALSWDDTDLEPAISVFQESKDICVVIGSTDGELRVESYDEIEGVLERARLYPAQKVGSNYFKV